ncbi:MAG: DNA-3-methyladenine glycosylase [Thermofilum sp.]|jgi:DNA-3-methyladenine glycosylase|nr:DNA-3-methyladenine glycosylase [Thermofilum sp.]
MEGVMVQMKLEMLSRRFYERRPDTVARELLGKIICKADVQRMGIIVETEPYFGPEDPASRARKGGNLAEVMRGQVCTALVYGVHRQWLLNIVAHPRGEYGAVLLRSVVPVECRDGQFSLLEPIIGPGRLTKYLSIDKGLHGKFLCREDSELKIYDYLSFEDRCISRSPRVGVKEDLPIPLNFKVRNECLRELGKPSLNNRFFG